MGYKKKTFFLVLGIIIIILLLFRKQIQNGLVYSPVRYYYSKILSHNFKEGIIPEDSIRFCEFEINHELDRGGVYTDDQDVTHPSILKLDGVEGDDIWMALTPYPQAQKYKGEPYENACIFSGNTKDQEPVTHFRSIRRNPVIFKNGAGFNSDCDIFYDNTDTCFYLVNRKRGGNAVSQIVLQNSKDGNAWSEPEVLFETDKPALCPCLIKVDTTYQIFVFNTYSQSKPCSDYEIWVSKTLKNPNFTLRKRVKWINPESIWHGDIVYRDGTYFMTACGINSMYTNIFGKKDVYKYLWLAKSKDGCNWKFCKKPLVQLSGVYRSTMYIEKDELIVYFSSHQRFFDNRHPAGNKIGVINVLFSKIQLE